MDPSPREVKILVADDSPVYRKLVEQSLSQEHYTVLLAKNGRQAMDMFAEHQPKLVITGSKIRLQSCWSSQRFDPIAEVSEFPDHPTSALSS
jgi:DNA-binding NtrC family response regulator